MSFFESCYICFSKENLVSCSRCVYHICERCIINEKFSVLKPHLCKHDECAYEYLTEEEKEDQHCYACSKKSTVIEYHCGTCRNLTKMDIKHLKKGILSQVTKTGTFERMAFNIQQKVVYYLIRDIDSDVCSMKSFWHV